MDELAAQADERMNRIRDYARPLFGYALKRTHTREEAEDLAQEIMQSPINAKRLQPASERSARTACGSLSGYYAVALLARTR